VTAPRSFVNLLEARATFLIFPGIPASVNTITNITIIDTNLFVFAIN
jgi:hypothetical protein